MRHFFFRQTFDRIDASDLRKKTHANFLVIISKLPTVNVSCVLQEIVDDFYAKNIINVNIIYKPAEERKIFFYTYYPYMDGNCSRANLVLQNVLENGVFAVDEPLFPNKLADLHGCSLRIAATETDDGEIEYIRNNKGLIVGLSGFAGRLMEAVAAKLNYTLQIIDVAPETTQIYPNGSAGGAIKLLQDGEVDIAVGLFHQHIDYWSRLDSTITFSSTDICFVVPKGIRLSPYERIIAPLDEIVWLHILGLLGVAAIFIALALVLPPMNRLVEMFVLVRVSIGVDVDTWPKSFTVRWMLIGLSITFLCLRTAYQTNLIYFLANDVRWPPIVTIDGMRESNYTIYVNSSVIIHALQSYRVHIQSIFNRSDIHRRIAEDQSFRGAIVMLRRRIDQTMQASIDNIYRFNLCATLQKNSFLTRTINDAMEKLLAGGLTERWEQEFRLIDENRRYEEVKQPISLEDSSACFFLYLGLIAIAIVIFAIEHAIFAWKRHVEKTKTTVVRLKFRRIKKRTGNFKKIPSRSKDNIVFRSKFLSSLNNQ